MKGFTKGKGEGKKFIPTEHKPKGVSKEKIAKVGKSSRIDNTKLLAKKTNNLITKEKAQSLSDTDLNRSIDFVNRIFSNQTQHLESNGGKFDSSVTEDQHEKTLDTLNMLIELQQQRKSGGRNMTNLDESENREKRSLDDDSKEYLLYNLDEMRERFPELEKVIQDNAPFGVDPKDMWHWEMNELVYLIPNDLQHKIDDYYYTKIEPFE